MVSRDNLRKWHCRREAEGAAPPLVLARMRIAARRWQTLYLVTTDNRSKSAVPRHNEVRDLLVKRICKDLEVSPPTKT